MAKASAKQSQPPTSLPARLAASLAVAKAPVTILLAERDNTALAFADHWKSAAFTPARARHTLTTCPTDSHSFARPQDKAWLTDQVRAALRPE
ncbi:hypothetical protein [Sphingomonas sp. J315]|uniref:hypothetical protein n=1 Tax=Sphingomonas sp. J315 TaxID=2898433 RepID=UPI00289C86F9|nr:hypothetical protein [Sphingomonas sp. J315]